MEILDVNQIDELQNEVGLNLASGIYMLAFHKF